MQAVPAGRFSFSLGGRSFGGSSDVKFFLAHMSFVCFTPFTSLSTSQSLFFLPAHFPFVCVGSALRLQSLQKETTSILEPFVGGFPPPPGRFRGSSPPRFIGNPGRGTSRGLTIGNPRVSPFPSQCTAERPHAPAALCLYTLWTLKCRFRCSTLWTLKCKFHGRCSTDFRL